MAVLVVFVLAVLIAAASFPAAEGKFSLSGLSSDHHSSATTPHRLSTLSTVQRKRGNPLAGHHPVVPGVPPCIPTKGLGHHPPGVGHHPPGAGGKPCSGRHPPSVTVPGHHPPGTGHHITGGHHPPGHGHHCSGNASICLDPALTPAGATQCCHTGCRNLLTDPKFCGSCYTRCRGGANTCCSGSCTNLLVDAQHCGSCGNVCAADVACTFGICGYA
jgi:hypothetical protein